DAPAQRPRTGLQAGSRSDDARDPGPAAGRSRLVIAPKSAAEYSRGSDQAVHSAADALQRSRAARAGLLLVDRGMGPGTTAFLHFLLCTLSLLRFRSFPLAPQAGTIPAHSRH